MPITEWPILGESDLGMQAAQTTAVNSWRFLARGHGAEPMQLKESLRHAVFGT